MGVSCVFEHNQSFLIGPVANRVHIAGKPDPVNGQYGLGVWRQPLFCVVQIEIEGARIDVHEHRHQTEKTHGHNRGEEGVTGRHDFAARRQIQREKHCG